MLQGNDNYTGTAARDTASALEVMMEAARGVAATTGDRDLQVGRLLGTTLSCYGFHWVTMDSIGLLWIANGWLWSPLGCYVFWNYIYQSFYLRKNSCKCLAFLKGQFIYQNCTKIMVSYLICSA